MDINFDDHLNRIASLCCDTEIDKDVIEKSSQKFCFR
jgi:hypothetical protein